MLGNSKNLPRGGKNRGTIRYRPNGLRASDPQMSDRQKSDFGCRVQQPDQLLAMVMNDDVRCDQLDVEDWIEIEQAAQSRRFFEENIQLEAENAALKAEIEALKAENAALKSQQSSPPAPESLNETGYRDAVTISMATIQLRKIGNFFRRTRLFFILLDILNQIIKYRCKFDSDEVEVEGCGSVLRKIFELVTSTTADISKKTLTIPDLDFKFYGSKEDFETFVKKVSEWVCENRLIIPDTHFIIGKMHRFTSKKQMLNSEIAKYEKCMIEVIDSATKEIFIIDIMNMDGSTVFPCDFSVNSLTVSPTSGIYAKDPLHRKGKKNFISVICDISSRMTTCMTRSPWKFEKPSLNFLVRQIKMCEADYEMQGAPVLSITTCPVTCEDEICVSLTGCRCKNTKGDPMPLPISIYAAIGIYEREKRCPNCRDILKEFVCSTVKSRQSMREPNELPCKAEFEWLIKRAEEISQGYTISGFKVFTEKSEDALRVLFEFSRKLEDEENDVPIRADGGGAAAAVFAPLMRAAAPVPAAPPMRAGGNAAAPVRPNQYDSDSDSDSDEEYYYGRNIHHGS
jgi:hypothetical protein